MKISKLPQYTKELALEYQKNEVNNLKYDKNTDYLNFAFEWSKTTEGYEFWCNLNKKELTIEPLNFPKLNDIKEHETIQSDLATKETEGKTFYELDFNFITQMAERMQSNKDNSKYELWNWKKPMTEKGIEDLKQATLRHLLEVLEDNYSDDNREFGHLEAIANNAMMINYQIKQLNK